MSNSAMSNSAVHKAPVRMSRAQADLFTATVAGFAVLALCALDATLQRCFGLPVWAPPLGAVCLIFSTEATSAAQKADVLSPAAIWTRAVQTVTGVMGACFLTVLLAKFCGPSSIGRAVGVSVASFWMAFFPGSGYFPPAGAFCALYIDKGAPGLQFALFPSGAGTLFLLVATRLIAAGLAHALSKLKGAPLMALGKAD